MPYVVELAVDPDRVNVVLHDREAVHLGLDGARFLVEVDPGLRSVELEQLLALLIDGIAELVQEVPDGFRHAVPLSAYRGLHRVREKLYGW